MTSMSVVTVLLTLVVFSIPRASPLAVVARQDNPYTSIADVAALPQVSGVRAIVRGSLTLNGNPSYIQDSTGGVAVLGLPAQGLRIGDELLVTGNARETEAGLVLRNSSAVLLWHGTPLPPFSVTAEEAALGKFADLLIEVNGVLTATQERNGTTWLLVSSGHQEFVAHLNSGYADSLLPKLQVGSRIRLRGICSLLPRDTSYLGGFAIVLRSAEDVSVLAGPPWWSFTHLLELGIILGALILTGHIAAVQILKARFRAIMNERARLGHELHDTLAQSFAGLSYQLQAARRIVRRNDDLLGRHLDVALDMVRHGHSEAHRSIMMLRPQPLAEGADLHSAIQVVLEQSTSECTLSARFFTTGPPARLALATTDTIYRVAQEAIANALRHGRPSSLEVALEYMPTSVRLSVRDNGVGFQFGDVRTQGFGLAGMKERVHAARGVFGVDSEPGRGTSVCAEFPLRRKFASDLVLVSLRFRAHRWNWWRRTLQDGNPDHQA